MDKIFSRKLLSVWGAMISIVALWTITAVIDASLVIELKEQFTIISGILGTLSGVQVWTQGNNDALSLRLNGNRIPDPQSKEG